MIIDCHAHLDLFSNKELNEIFSKSEKIKYVIVNSVDLKTSQKILKLSKKYPKIKVALGLYPQDALSRENKTKVKDNFEDFEKIVLENKKEVIAIGEIGMDFYHGSEKNKKEQEKLFREQVELAEKLNIPVVVHTRGAEKEIIEILKDYPNVKKVLHCFCGNMKLVKEAEKIGCYFTIPCSLKRMQNFLKVLEIISKDRILTETDAPYLSPFKDKKNEPAFIRETIKEISRIWKMDEKEVERIIERNSERIFGF
jgi:TatD DNase family protein